ncbi:MAG: hypothetical protein HP493_12470 [Nitrospira sp.]|nr:hypothetical protein [Nitrospira sp.]
MPRPGGSPATLGEVAQDLANRLIRIFTLDDRTRRPRTAWLAVFERTDKTKIQARSFLNGLEIHLGEACMGQISEVFDGDAPHHPRGCPAQAWSVAEPLRAMIEDLGVTIEQNTTRSRRVTIRSRRGA